MLWRNAKINIYRTIVLPVVLYGCQTWSLTLRLEHRLRVFENRVPRKISGLKRDEIRGWRRIHNMELYDLYSSGAHIKKNDMDEACGTYGNRRGAVHTGFGGET